MNYEKFELPVEYASLMYLHTKLGDIETVECVCSIWNKLNIGNTLRVKSVEDMTGTVTLTGVCKDPELAVKICKWLVTIMVAVKYEKTIVKMEFER